jgi:hypothetical protein
VTDAEVRELRRDMRSRPAHSDEGNARSADASLTGRAPHQELASVAFINNVSGLIFESETSPADDDVKRVSTSIDPDAPVRSVKPQNQGAHRPVHEPTGQDSATELALGLEINGGRSHRPLKRVRVANDDGTSIHPSFFRNACECERRNMQAELITRGAGVGGGDGDHSAIRHHVAGRSDTANQDRGVLRTIRQQEPAELGELSVCEPQLTAHHQTSER